ncbi:zinc ribbon domain-containing protein [Zavarzinella formosa]|uniref:hypothetical protein n=1 Tax=Zavarzinella formosa TaxID=360055 RepID=UPI00037803E0|nr:hypothetical protein [Zavarzinella formosa]
MPTITCPECEGKSKFPDDSPPRRVKCPACGHVFLSSDGLPSKSASKDADDAGEKKKSRSKDDLDLDDDRPRRRRRDDDDDDDRDRRSSRRRRDDDDDDDDDDDRDRRSSRRRRDDDDDDDRDRPRRKNRDRSKENQQALEGQFNRTGLACLLLMICGWIIVGALGLVAFRVFLAMCGISDNTEFLDIIAGMLGVGGWLTGLVGLGFAVSGPRDRGGMGFSISMAGCGLLHFLLLIIIPSTPFAYLGATVGSGRSGLVWDCFVTQSAAIPTWMFWIIAFSGRLGFVPFPALPMLANLAEIGRIVLLMLFLRSVMLCAGDNKTARFCLKSMIGYASSAGGMLVLGVVFGIIFLMAVPTGNMNADRNGKETAELMGHLYKLVTTLAVAGLNTWITLVVMKVKNRIDYRA